MQNIMRCGLVLLLPGLAVFSAAAGVAEDLQYQGDRITILRDGYGVPHVYAQTLPGLFYGNGYACAQDRLAQMEFYRRSARGEMAEMVGESALKADRETRVDGYSEAERENQFRALPSDQQEILKAYAAGVNSWREKAIASGRLPARLRALSLKPGPWRVTDSIAVGQDMARKFGSVFAGEELRNVLFAGFMKFRGPKDAWTLLNDLTWRNDPRAPTTLPEAEHTRKFSGQTHFSGKAVNLEMFFGKTAKYDTGAIEGALAHVQLQESRRLALQYGLPTRLGSYGFVVHPSKSVTGNALLVGGPEMGWMTPQIAHEMHLSGAGVDLIGMGFAGAPGILIGHNAHLAWTFTSGIGDIVDIFAEKLNPQNSHQYWYKGAWRDMEKRVETIVVKGSEPVTQEVYRTVHGPVVQFDVGSGRAYAKNAAYWGHEMDSLGAYSRCYQARTAAEFMDAVSGIPTSFNALCATQDGDIAWRFCGRVPVRADGIDPRFPTPGTGDYDWKGFVPLDQMPHSTNPRQGFLANWNTKPATWWDCGDTPVWGAIWHSARIAELLRARPKLSADDLRAVLRDIGTNDENAEHFVPPLLKAAKNESGLLEPAARQALAYLASWDYHGEEGSVAQEIFNTWLQQVREDLFWKHFGGLPGFAGRSGKEVFNLAMQPSFILHALQGSRASVPVRFDYLKGRTADQVMAQALNTACRTLTERYGPQPSRWRFHRGQLNLSPLPGIPDTHRGTYIQIVECARPNLSGVNVLAPGQSEDPDSPHFGDQREMAGWWMFKPMLTRRAEIEKSAASPHEPSSGSTWPPRGSALRTGTGEGR